MTFVYVCAFSQSESQVCLAMLIDHQCYYAFRGFYASVAGCKTYFDCFYSCGEHAFDRGESLLLLYAVVYSIAKLLFVCFFPQKNIYLSELFVLEERRMRTNAAVALFCTLDLYALRFSIRGRSYSPQYLQIPDSFI